MQPVQPNPSALPTGREVLVVEDEQRLRAMLQDALKEMGYKGTFAGSAESALKMLEARSFDILILDLNLPGMSGMELLSTLRSRSVDSQAIIMTGFGDLEAAKQAIHLDVVEFLTKPCSLGKLEAALDRASKRRRGQIVNETPAQPARLKFVADPTSQTVDLSLEDLERKHILEVLREHDGNRVATAQKLGISLRKLYYRLGEYQKKGLLDTDEG